jgi:DNA-binding HxlR family transcriptional regulator
MDMTVDPIIDMLRNCRHVAPVLSQVGDKWTVLIIMSLRTGPRRFNDIKRTVTGISQQMLTRTLKTLERDGMVIRTALPTTPPQVHYELSPLGHSLSVPVVAIGRWVQDHIAEIEQARTVFDSRA